MRRENLLARLLRALSGKSQEQMAEELGLHPSHIASFEKDRIVPSPEHLEGLAAAAGITVRDAEEILRLYEAFRQAARPPRARSADEILGAHAERLRVHLEAAYRRVLTLPLPTGTPGPEDRARAGELWERLKDLPDETRLAVVHVAGELQSRALYERVSAESAAEADPERSAALARLAGEIGCRTGLDLETSKLSRAH